MDLNLEGPEWQNVALGVRGTQVEEELRASWTNILLDISKLGKNDWGSSRKSRPLPWARVRKVMAIALAMEDSGHYSLNREATVIMAKAAEIFITELTVRSWDQVRHYSRTLFRRCDILTSSAKSDMYDFLIDILENGDVAVKKPEESSSTVVSRPSVPSPGTIWTANLTLGDW